MKRHLQFALVLSLAATLGACSSAQTGDASLEEIPAAEAGTDAVPVEGAEMQQLPPAEGDPNAVAQQVPPPADPNQPPVDPNQAQVVPPPADPNAQPSPDPNAAAQTAAVATDPNAAQQPPAQPIAPPADANLAAQTAAVGGSGGAVEDYTFQEGDTLMKIAFETYGDLYAWRKIYDANRDRISNPNAVPRGTVLKLEKPSVAPSIDRNGERYLIKYGDTLGTISGDVYGTRSKWRQLWENNRQLIRDPNRIFAGFYLYYTMNPDEQQQKEQKTAPAPLAESNPAAASAQAAAPAPAAPFAQDALQPLSTTAGAEAAPAPVVADPSAAAPAPVEEARVPASAGSGS